MAAQYQIRIKPDGEWHRRGPDGKTACGELIPGAVQSRDWELDENMCGKCFTRHERDTGKMKKLERELEQRNDPHLFGDEGDNTPTDPLIPPLPPAPSGGDEGAGSN